MAKSDSSQVKKSASPKIAVAVIVAVGVCAIVGSVLVIAFRKPYKTAEYNLRRMYFENEYDALFISMYDISEYYPDTFKTFRGLETFTDTNYYPVNAEEITAVLTMFSRDLVKKQKRVDEIAQYNKTESRPLITHMFIGVNPLGFANEEEMVKFKEALDVSYPYLPIDILLSPYSGRYLTSLGDEQREELMNKYRLFAQVFSGDEHLHVYFPGSSMWLTANQGCYLEGSSTAVEGSVASKIIRYCFCDGQYAVSADNVEEYITQWENAVTFTRDNPMLLSGTPLPVDNIVCYGDSIFGLYEGPLSATGVMETLTGVRAYNCGIGGMTLTDTDVFPGLYAMMDYSKDTSEDFATSVSSIGLRFNAIEFLDASKLVRSEDASSNTNIVIEFGINDYECGIPIEDFRNSLYKDISYLKDNLHAANVLILGPGCIRSDEVSDGQIPVGNGAALDEYRDALKEAAAKNDMMYLDLRDLNGENLLETDGIHLNEDGRLLMGMAIVDAFSQTE